MKKRSIKARQHPPARPIALVCVSPHEDPGPGQKEPDKLTRLRGKWAWCPSGAGSGHDWQPIKSGSLNPLRVQLVEVSRLVDLALNDPRGSTTTANANKSRSRKKR